MKKIAIAIMMAAICCIALAACNNPADHEHIFGDYTVVIEPTCTLEGKKTAVCKICGFKTSEKIDKLGHDYGDEPVWQRDPTAETDGEARYECKNGCGVPKIVKIPALKHDFSGEVTEIPPTCTENGERRVKCTHCDEVQVTVLKATGHKYGDSVVVKEPTCQSAGERKYTCTVCHKEVTESIDPIGHTYGDSVVVKEPTCHSEGERKYTCTVCHKEVTEPIEMLDHEYGDYVVDKASTETEDGQKSRHCVNEGCDAKADITVLPKGKYVEYTVKVVRSDGRSYLYSSELKVKLLDEENNDQVVKTYTFSGGTAKFKIEHKPYKVVLIGLRQGYTQKDETRLDRGAVDMKIKLAASVVENKNEAKPSRSLGKGDPMFDFKVRDVEKAESEQKMFSELLKGKKGAYIDFFYVHCGACKQQFPIFTSVYSSFGEKAKDILVILVDVYDEDAASIKEYKSPYPKDIIAAKGVISSTNNLYEWVPCPYFGVPFGYFVDSEGVIDELVNSNNVTAEYLENIYTDVLTRYLG